MAKGTLQIWLIKDFDIRKIILDYLKGFNVLINFLKSWKGKKEVRMMPCEKCLILCCWL